MPTKIDQEDARKLVEVLYKVLTVETCTNGVRFLT